MRYEVNTDIYAGPLTLLVELAKHNLLSIFYVHLQELTAEYLKQVKEGQATLNELAEPLPLLGQLVALKARALLPMPPQPAEEEELPVSLAELQRRLAEYEQFKTVADVLAQLHSLQHDRLGRLTTTELEALMAAGAEDAAAAPVAPVEGPAKEVGLLDLMAAFSRVLERTKAPLYEVNQDSWTVEMKVEELKIRLQVKRQLSFTELFSPEKARLELVVIFLALLELVRQRVCAAIQERPFGDIVIMRRESSEAAA